VKASEFIGGLAVVGVIALIGFAIADESGSDAITSAPAPTILPPIDSAAATNTSPDATAPATALASQSSDAPIETSAPNTASTSDPSTTTTSAPATSTTVALIPIEDRASVRVRVLNGGGPEGAATFTSGVLEGEGFSPEGPSDSAAGVAQNTIIFRPGQGSAAATVNESINAAAEFVVEASPDNPNWNEFGADIDVLVVIGPA
jgi:hypothetical protein